MGVAQPNRCLCGQPRRHYLNDEEVERAITEAKATGNDPHLANLQLLKMCPMRGL